MFFAKKQPNQEAPKQEAPKQEYDLELDKLQTELGAAFNLKAYLDDGHKLISVERDNLDAEDEKTIVYTLGKSGEICDQKFYVSRAQHKQLVAQFENLTKE